MKRLKNLVFGIFVFSYLGICYTIYWHHSPLEIKKIVSPPQQDKRFAFVEIPKLNLKQELFQKEDPRNQVDQNIMLLKESSMPDEENSIVLLAAHSGNGPHTYFNQLDILKPNDLIIFYYKQVNYIYQVNTLYEEPKNGKIHITGIPNQKQIILTTCSKTNQNKQLIVTGILIQEKRETN